VTDIERYARRLAGISIAVQATVRRELMETGTRAVGTAKQNASSRLAVRTGRLRGSIALGVVQSGETTDLALTAGGPAVSYAAIHEYGGTIYPKTGRYLTIPIAPWLKTRTGATSKRGLGGARSIANTFVFRAKSGKLFIARRATAARQKGKIELLYLLVQSVTMRERRYMRDAFDAATAGLDTRLRDRMAALVRP
jgi:phage gpG-like protein